MDNELTPEETLQKALEGIKGSLAPKTYAILSNFLTCYRKAVPSFPETLPTLLLFLQMAAHQSQEPYTFAPYHQKIRSPIDYYRFGLDFARPLVDFSRSTLGDPRVLDSIEEALSRGENVILLANHQTEVDPQILSLLLEKKYPKLAESIIYVAGERVVTDPIAIPFSMGCDLLCIYSKRYIDHPAELKAEKLVHNQKTMEKMRRLLEEGGKAIYVAPSGGRDRKDSEGKIQVAPFDPDSIEMFSLMAKKAKRPAHFHPLTLVTYDLLPPPETIQTELGEERFVKHTSVHAFFSPPFPMDDYPGSNDPDKLERRKKRAAALWSLVSAKYQTLTERDGLF